MSKKLYTKQEVVVMQFLVEHIGGHMVNIVRGAGTPDAEDLLGLSIGRGKTVAIRDLLEAALSTAGSVQPFGWTSKHMNDGEQHRLWGRNRENVAGYKGVVVQALYAAPPAPSVAVKALQTVRNELRVDTSNGRPGSISYEADALHRIVAAVDAALSAQVQDLEGLSAWQGWDQSRMPWSEAKHKDAVCYAAFGEAWSMNDAAALIGFIERTWTAAPAAKLEEKP